MLRTAALNSAITLLSLLLGAVGGQFLGVLGPATFEEDGPQVATAAAQAPVVDIGEDPVPEPPRPGRAEGRDLRENAIERTDPPGRQVAAQDAATTGGPAVTIMGPADAMLGDQVYLRAVVTGDVAFYRWRVSPAVDGLIVMDGGRSAVFSNRNPGLYRFVCAVSGPGGVEIDEAEVEVVDTAGEAAGGDTGALPVNPAPVPMSSAAPQGAAVPEMSLEEQRQAFDLQVAALVGRVRSTTRVAEAKIVSGVFRLVADGLQAGTLPATQDPLTMVVRQADVALGVNAGAWRAFFTAFAEATNNQRAAAPRDANLFSATAASLARLQ
jgi:hypothetical protein